MASDPLNRPGVYVIVHRGSGKLYVGSAVNIRERWKVHRCKLRRGNHHSQRLQNAWNKHGTDVFAFAVITFCEPSELISREQRWIDELEACGRMGYNINPTAGSQLGAKHSEASREKMSLAHRGKKLPPEQIEKLRGHKLSPERRERLLEYSAMYNKQPKSQEHRDKIAASLKGRKLSPGQREARKGKRLSPETRAKISAVQKGRKKSPEEIANIATARRGTKRSPETCARISASKRGTKRSAESIAKAKATYKANRLARMSMVQGELFT